MLCLHPKICLAGLELVSLTAVLKKPHWSSTALSALAPSIITTQGDARGRLEVDVEHRDSLVSTLQCCFQQAGLQHLWRQSRTGIRWTEAPAGLHSEQPDTPHCWSGKKSTASHQLLPHTCKSIWRPSPNSEADIQHSPGSSTLCPAPPDPKVPSPESSEGSSTISCLQQQQQRPGGPAQGPAPSTPASRVSPKEQLRQRASTTGDLGTLCTHMEPTRLIPVRGRHNSPASDRPRCEMGQRKACNYFKSNSSLALPTAQHTVCNHISSC